MKNKIMEWIKADRLRAIFVALALIMLAVMPMISRDAGMSADEHFHFQQAENVVNFYRTFGRDTSAVVGAGGVYGIQQYGQLPDNISFLIADIFNIENILTTRHFVNSIFGWIGILFAGLLAFRISGSWLAAIITATLLFLSPRYLGHSFNNLKDIPFAAMMMMGTYYLTRFFQTFPKPPKHILIMLAVSIGLALAVRVGGLLLIAYFGLFGILFFLSKSFEAWRKTKSNKKVVAQEKKNISNLFVRLLKLGLIVSLGGYALGVFLWPYALVSPINNVASTFATMSEFGASIRQNFGGVMIWSDLLPWYYIPKFILITVPIAVLIGLGLFFVLLWKNKQNYFWYFIIFFAFFFPIFWLAYTGANVYGGWRHALFVYPPMVVMAGLGFNALIGFGKQHYQKVLLAILPFALLIQPAMFIVKNHPYQYVYFNRIVGGVPGAFGFFELDYYYHSTREASEWVIANATKTGLETGDRIRVVSFHHPSVQHFFRHHTDRFDIGFSRWAERGNNDWDYAIFTITGMNPEMLRSDMFPPANTVHQIKVSGVPIAIILKRTDKSDYFGNQLRNEGQLDAALALLKHSLTLVPSGEATLINIAEIYLRKNQNDSSIVYLDKLLAFDPRNEIANYFRAHALLRQNRLDEAQQNLLVIVNHNPKNDTGPWLSAQLHAQQGNLVLMERMLERMLIANANRQQEALDLMRRAYQQANMSENDANIAFTRIWINVLETLGFTAEARQLRNQR